MDAEKKLIKEAVRGDQKAFAKLISPYREKLYHKAFSMAGNHDDAMDILQEAIISSFQSLSGFQNRSAFYTWIFSILVNAGRNYLKKRNRSPGSIEDHESFISDDRLHFTENLELSEESKSLMKYIQSLEDKYKEIILLRYYDELSYEQIAEHLGIHIGTVKSRLSQAKELLRRSLYTEGDGENSFVRS